MRDKLKYWIPRLLIIGFIVSMPFSAPEFITSMDEAAFTVWLLRLIWVIAFPSAFCLALILVLVLRKYKFKK